MPSMSLLQTHPPTKVTKVAKHAQVRVQKAESRPTTTAATHHTPIAFALVAFPAAYFLSLPPILSATCCYYTDPICPQSGEEEHKAAASAVSASIALC